MTIAILPSSPAGEISHGDVRLKLNEVINRLNQIQSGWATYIDTQYPDLANAFSVPANTDTLLPNNAGSVIDFQKPDYIPAYYDGSTIAGRNGDGLDIMLYFTAVPSINNQDMDIWIDIGGTVGELYRQSFRFPRGAGIARGILYALPSAYTLNTWQANGGTVYISSPNPLQIYGINYNFDTSHKAI